MRPRNKFFAIAAVAALAGLGYGTWAAVRAKANLVTPDVRDMYDYENFHSDRSGGAKNVLFADFHVDKL
jgi:prepilin-type processing-associated H-X9-DG protein